MWAQRIKKDMLILCLEVDKIMTHAFSLVTNSKLHIRISGVPKV